MGKSSNPSFEIAMKVIAILDLIPEYPKYTTVQEVKERLERRDIYMGDRGVLRYLNNMAGYFPIDCCDKGKPYKWRKIA